MLKGRGFWSSRGTLKENFYTIDQSLPVLTSPELVALTTGCNWS